MILKLAGNNPTTHTLAPTIPKPAHPRIRRHRALRANKYQGMTASDTRTTQPAAIYPRQPHSFIPVSSCNQRKSEQRHTQKQNKQEQRRPMVQGALTTGFRHAKRRVRFPATTLSCVEGMRNPVPGGVEPR